MSKSIKMFDKAAFGYKPDDVDRHIEELNQRIQKLESEKQDMLGKMQLLADKINEYRSEESSLKDALLGAQKMATTIVGEAKTKADMLLTDAKARSERMVYDAQKAAEETVSNVKQQVEREKMILVKMQREVSDFKARLLSIYKSHLNIITTLPDTITEIPDMAEPIRERTFTEPAPSPVYESAPEEPEESPEEQEEAPTDGEEEISNTVRLDKVPAAAPMEQPGHKPSFEEKFGELKFGKNNKL